MTAEENRVFEYRTFVLGVIVLGGFFGVFIFRNASEFWGLAPTWSLAGSVGASLLLCLVPVLSYRPQSGVKIWMFLVSLALTIGLVMWYDAGHDLPGSAAGVKGLLASVQLASSWKYLLFVLIPITLSISAHWVCGGFLLSLKRFIAGRKNKSLPQSRALFASTTAGVAMLLAFTIGFSASMESGSFFVGLQYPEGISGERQNVEIGRLKAEMLEHFEELESIDVFVGRVDVGHAVASSIFEQQILLVLNQEDRWRRGKARKLLEKSLRAYGSIGIGFEVFDTTYRPSVPVREVYTSTELNFIPNSALLEQLGITETALSAALATRLRLSSGDDSLQTLQGLKFMVEGQYIDVNQLGSFEVISTEVKGSDLPAPHWETFSQDIDARMSGIAIILDETILVRYGLDLGELETTIINHLNAEVSSMDIALLEHLTIAETQDERRIVIRLRDIARIEQTWITNPQGEVNGVPYKIQLNVR